MSPCYKLPNMLSSTEAMKNRRVFPLDPFIINTCMMDGGGGVLVHGSMGK